MFSCNYKQSQLQQLKAFCLVVEYQGNLSAVAKKLNTSTATISRQISALEKDLGMTLFTSGQYNKLKPNEQAIIFVKKAKIALQNIDELYKGNFKISENIVIKQNIYNKLDIYKIIITDNIKVSRSFIVKKLKVMLIKITLGRFSK